MTEVSVRSVIQTKSLRLDGVKEKECTCNLTVVEKAREVREAEEVRELKEAGRYRTLV